MKRELLTATILSVLVGVIAQAQDFCPTQQPAWLAGLPPVSRQYVNSTVTLKILLVEFSDRFHRTSPTPYKRSDFTDALVSSGVYVMPNKLSPDGESVYGSLRDWYNKMSSGSLTVTGFVVNNATYNDYPEWIRLGQTKAYWNTHSYWDFLNVARDSARNHGLDVDGLGEFVKLVIIYAGNTYWGGQLNPAANGMSPSATIYITSERQGNPQNVDNPTDTFLRIGVSCHEFAHLLGVGHATGSRLDIMDAGRRNGPVLTGSCGSAPAPMNPAHRAQLNWITPGVVSGQQTYDLYYSLTAPQVKRVNSNTGGDYYLFENRRFNQTMVIGSTTVPDYNNTAFFPAAWPHGTQTQGVFVWKVRGGNPSAYSNNGLIYASGRYGATYPEGIPSEGDDGVMYPGVAGITVLSPWSDSRPPYVGTAPYNIFVPNTQYGTNVGMEITGQNPTAGYVSVKLYQTAPENASPSKPQSLAIAIYSGHPRVTWSAMQEPDVITGGNIFVERRLKPVGTPWTAWGVVATLGGTASSHIDATIDRPCVGNCPDSVQYRIRARDSQQKYSIYSEVVSITALLKAAETMSFARGPEKFDLLGGYPNPFNPSTTIHYSLAHPGQVTLIVFNTVGQQVAELVNSYQERAYYGVVFSGNNLSSGVYYARLLVRDDLQKLVYQKTAKVLLTK